MYYAFAIIVLLIYALVLIYIVGKFKRSHALQKLKEFNKQIYYLITFMFILLLLLFAVMDAINAFIVYFHFLIFSLIFDLIFLIFRKKLRFNISLILAILTTFIYLVIGYYNVYHVRKTIYNF